MPWALRSPQRLAQGLSNAHSVLTFQQTRSPSASPHSLWGGFLKKWSTPVVSKCQSQLHEDHPESSSPETQPPEILIQWEWMGPWNLCCRVSFHSNFIIQPWLEPKSSPFPSLAIVIGFLLSPHNWCYCFKDLHNHLPGKKSSGPFKILGLLDFLETYDTDDKWVFSLSVPSVAFVPGPPMLVVSAPWSSFIFLCYFLNWSIVDSQCCVSFRYIVKWFSHTCVC